MVQVFNSSEFGQVRAVTKDNETWFVGKDVATILGYKDTSDAIKNHVDEDDKGVGEIPTPGGTQKMITVNESGMYSLILSSKLPQAKKFKRWVTSEILPSVRKNGAYMTENTLEKALTSPDFLIQLATNLKAEQEARRVAENRIIELKPKADFYDDVAGSKDSIEVGQVAKVLAIKGVGRNKLFEILRDKKILDRSNIPYQKYVDLGYFRVLEQKYQIPSGETKINIKTMVFQKGVDFIRKNVKEEM